MCSIVLSESATQTFVILRHIYIETIVDYKSRHSAEAQSVEERATYSREVCSENAIHKNYFPFGLSPDCCFRPGK